MFKKFLKEFGRSNNWKIIRKIHLKDNPTCAACGRKDNLEVHHIIPYHIDKTKELDPKNLITLCDKYCHFVFGHFMDCNSWNIRVVEDSEKYFLAKNNRPVNMSIKSEEEMSYEKVCHANILFSILHKYISWYNRSKDR